VNELADYEEPKHPPHRPPYLRLIPLAEVIALALGAPDPNAKAVRDVWGTLVSALGDEVTVLVDADVAQLDMVDESVQDAIVAFREGKIILHPGGGGQYGRVELPRGFKKSKSQRSLSDFSAID